MSQISTVVNELVTQVKVLFPAASGWTMLQNPYRPDKNPGALLTQGWGIQLGAAQNLGEFINSRYSMRRTVAILHSRQYSANQADPDARLACELQLLEDQKVLLAYLEANPQLGGTCTATALDSDGGMEYVQADSFAYLVLKTELQVSYTESY